ncbi:hypothetical protein GUJ93_ZPchr0586g11360 [Zizania palustris]|uniref:Bulb-type lectin domain-containing protein n=1 Tax=Zizania palustris TaxID=103762 RepID=A0A8J5QUM4_ZIZPA|nr:hypothetical protein GUJ93_ZPchr0586g11360 [Zizania palustris]
MAPPLFLLFLQLLVLVCSSSAQAQNISLGTSLTTQGPNKAWLSPSGDFAFGFRPIEDNSSFYLLAVWFDKISDKTVVWYAKTVEQEPQPIQVPSGSSLLLTSTGVLSLRDPTGREYGIQAQLVHPMLACSTREILWLRLQGSSISWETFKNPTDTILISQVLSPGMALRSRLLTTDYSNGRIYISMDNGTQIDLASAAVGSMEDYYHRATLDQDGVFRQYVYPRKLSSLSSPTWTSVAIQPENICDAMTKRSIFFDEQRKDKGCKPDFQPQSCDLDEAGAMGQYEFNLVNNVDWPLADYEQYTPIGMDECRQLCLIDCFCAVAVFHDNTCWKKKLPLSNGNMASTVQRTVFIKVQRNNSSQPEFDKPSKWKSDKKGWILGIVTVVSPGRKSNHCNHHKTQDCP